MKLTLDHTQRLNLHVLIGAQRGSLDEIRALWKLQDILDLTPEDKEKIGYKLVGPEGQQTPIWSFNGLPPREFDFSRTDYDRLYKVVTEWQQGFAAADRKWLEPLLNQFEELDKEKDKSKDNKPQAVAPKATSAA